MKMVSKIHTEPQQSRMLLLRQEVERNVGPSEPNFLPTAGPIENEGEVMYIGGA